MHAGTGLHAAPTAAEPQAAPVPRCVSEAIVLPCTGLAALGPLAPWSSMHAGGTTAHSWPTTTQRQWCEVQHVCACFGVALA